MIEYTGNNFWLDFLGVIVPLLIVVAAAVFAIRLNNKADNYKYGNYLKDKTGFRRKKK